MAKKYYWLKLKEDFFRQKEIKKLRKIAGGDTYTIIYLKMMLLSLKEEGKLFFEGLEDSFIEEVALEIDEDIENVKVTILFLIKAGLIEEITENEYILTKAAESIGTESESKERVRKFRERKKQLLITDSVTCNANVTKCNTDIYIEKEIDKDIYNSIIEYLNLKADKKYRSNSKATVKVINARLKEKYTLEDFKTVIDNKVSTWKGKIVKNKDGSEFIGDNYLRPETLFGNKFESYLNEKNKSDSDNEFIDYELQKKIEERKKAMKGL